MTLPYLSSYHTLENSQGTLDPLGLYTIADRLALQLVPGFRERMSHPRYLTAMAVGAIVCSVFDDDELAKDEISPPWQVYEWYVTSALVKRFEKNDPGQLIGMPGREKTTRAFKDNMPLNASAYLKTPSVFGFHGVYRTLARNIKLLDGTRIGEFGTVLVDTWEKEQGLDGFRIGLKGTPGYEFRKKLEEAIRSGLSAGAVAKSWTWDFYTRLAESLAPKSPGKKEAALILNELMKGETGSRAVVINFLGSMDTATLAKATSEKEIHNWLLSKNPSNSALLKAIQAYEKISRLLYNAFYSILQETAAQKGKITISQLSSLSNVKKGFEELPAAFQEAEILLSPFTAELVLFNENFQTLREQHTLEEWIILLIEHHFRIQKNKPPAGKSPWLLEYTKSSYLLNVQQAIDVTLSDEYVHQYRTSSIRSFLNDLTNS